mmetsp:Transcript_5284/g.11559  ORF Transcript_5284/g.11559 Transcript_5284/m.11559 type:complete len:332 (+) Transcript_5284:36-1031(+)
MKSPKTKTSKPAAVTRPYDTRLYNRYNIFFILERENIILRKGGTTRWSTTSPNLPTSSENESAPSSSPTPSPFKNLDLPPLPSRFRNLGYIPADWCIPGQAKKRPHRRSHGVATFRELAQSIAASWKTIDGETMEFCSAVEKALKQRQEIMMRDPKFVDHTNDQQQQSSKPSASHIQQAKLKPKKQAKKKQIIKPKHVRSQKEQAPVKPKQVRSKQVATKSNPKPVTRQVASVSVSRSYDLIPSVPRNAAAPVGVSLPAMAPQPASNVQNFLFRDNNTLHKDDISIQPIAATLDEDNLFWDASEDAEMFGECDPGSDLQTVLNGLSYCHNI